MTPKISIPVGFVFSQPAPELSAWYRREKARKKQQVPKAQRPPTPAPHPNYPTKQQRALRLREDCKANHPDIRVYLITADALYGAGPFVDTASALYGGIHVLAQIRSNQNIRVGEREQHVADYFATHPGTPQRICIRGGRRSWPWSAAPACTSALTKPNALSSRLNMNAFIGFRGLRLPWSQNIFTHF